MGESSVRADEVRRRLIEVRRLLSRRAASDQVIGRALKISPNTVKNFRKNLVETNDLTVDLIDGWLAQNDPRNHRVSSEEGPSAARLVSLLATVPELRHLAHRVGPGTIMDALHWTARHFGWEGDELKPIAGAQERIFGKLPDVEFPENPWLERLDLDDHEDGRREAAENGG